MHQELWQLAVYFAATLALITVMLLVSHFLGQRHRDPATGSAYESGIATTGDARLRFSAKFYLVAVAFVIFDLEVVYLLTWAVSATELGWVGYAEIALFAAVLLVALVYLWRGGALDWGSSAQLSSERKRTDEMVAEPRQTS